MADHFSFSTEQSGEPEQEVAGSEEGSADQVPKAAKATDTAITETEKKTTANILSSEKPHPDEVEVSKEDLFYGAFGDRGSMLVVIGVDLDKKKVTAALENALLSEKETVLAAKEKLTFEAYCAKVKAEGGKKALEAVDKTTLQKNTNGMVTPWDRFLKYEDPFFGGKVVEHSRQHCLLSMRTMANS
eukprot:g15328.t1